jgi:RNA polymerase sigma factor (sigma-70 family)
VTVDDVTVQDALVAEILAARTDRKAWAEAWRRAVEANRKKMFAAAMSKLHDIDDANDAVQTTLMEMITMDPAKFAAVENLASYLARAAAFNAIDIVRQDQRLDVTDPDEMPTPPEGVVDVEDSVIDGLALADAVALFDEMPPKVRYALEERWLLGRRAKDVAAELQVEPPYISQLVDKGLQFISERSAFVDRSAPDLNSPSTSTVEPKDPV